MADSWDGHLHSEYAGYHHGHEEYVTWDELEDKLRDLTRDISDDNGRDFSPRVHDHDEFGDQGRELDELRDQLHTVTESALDLTGLVKELMRDRDAMIRRMRLLEDALSLAPPADSLTSRDDPPFRPTPVLGLIQGLPEDGQ